MRPRLPLTKRELFVQSLPMTSKDCTRIAFQAVAIVSLGVVLFEQVSRMFREINRDHGKGRST